ncbi:MAG: hypothetical protein ACXWRE_11120 [Pseudobdellovibrionaceae bacterium]
MNSFSISDFRLNVFTIPTQTKFESDGTLEWDSTTLIIVELKTSDQWGIGYTYGDKSIAIVVNSLIEKYVLGQEALNISLIWEK